MAVRIKAGDVQQLVDFLSTYLPSASEVHGAVQSAADGHVQLGIWVDTWPSPKAVVVRPMDEVNYLWSIYSVFAVDQSALRGPLDAGVRPYDWQNSALFAAIPKRYLKPIGDLANKHGCHLGTRDLVWADIYQVDKDSLKDTNIPEDMSCGTLTQEHAQLVNDSWTYTRGDETLPYFKWTIKHFPTIGLFGKNGDLVAFELVMYYGAIGTLFVKPEFRRKGYASFVTTAICQKLFAEGRTPFVYLDQHNEASIQFHRKLGFKKAEVDPVAWARTFPGSQFNEMPR